MTTMRERARAWLLHQPQEPDDLPSLTALLEAVERETVERCKLAVEKASRDSVRRFGQLMVNDHMGVNKAAADLAFKRTIDWFNKHVRG